MKKLFSLRFLQRFWECFLSSVRLILCAGERKPIIKRKTTVKRRVLSENRQFDLYSSERRKISRSDERNTEFKNGARRR